MEGSEMSDSDLLSCGACKRSFDLSNISGFMKHKRFDCEDPGIHTDPKSKTLVCLSCRQKFQSPWGLLKHAQNVHFLQIFLEQTYNLGLQCIHGSEDSAVHPSYSPLHGLDHSLTALSGGQTVQQWIQGIEQEMDKVEKSIPVDNSTIAKFTNVDVTTSKRNPCCSNHSNNILSHSKSEIVAAGNGKVSSGSGSYVPNVPSRGKGINGLVAAADSLTQVKSQYATGKLLPSLDSTATTTTAENSLSRGQILPNVNNSSVPEGSSRGKLFPSLGSTTREAVSRGKLLPSLDAAIAGTSRDADTSRLVPTQGKMISSDMLEANNLNNDSLASDAFDVAAETLFSENLLRSVDYGRESIQGNLSAGKFTLPMSKSNETTFKGKAMPAQNKSHQPISHGKLIESLLPPTVPIDTDHAILSLGDDDPFFDTAVPSLAVPDDNGFPSDKSAIMNAVHTGEIKGDTDMALSPLVSSSNTSSRSWSVSSMKDSDNCCDNPDCCVRNAKQGKLCDNQNCGITVMPGSHESMKKCCISVVPKKRKRHMETKHKAGHRALSKTRKRDKGRMASPAGNYNESSQSTVGSKLPRTDADGVSSLINAEVPLNKENDTGVMNIPLKTGYSSASVIGGQSESLLTVQTSNSQSDTRALGSLDSTQVFPTANSNSGSVVVVPVQSNINARSSAQSVMAQNMHRVQQTGISYQLPSLSAVPIGGLIGSAKPSNPAMSHVDVGQSILETLGNLQQQQRRQTAINKAGQNIIVSALKEAVNVPLVSSVSSTSNNMIGSVSSSSNNNHNTEVIVNSTEQGGNNDSFLSSENNHSDVELTDTEEASGSHFIQSSDSARKVLASGTKKRQYPTSRPYKCDQCGSAFNQRVHLKKHLSKHTGIKPFKCDHCDYSTVERSHLRVHVRVHTGEKPFKCDYCDYATAQNSTLKIHLKRHHAGPNRPSKKSHSNNRNNNNHSNKEGTPLAESHLLSDPVPGMILPPIQVISKQDAILSLLPSESSTLSSSAEGSKSNEYITSADKEIMESLASTSR